MTREEFQKLTESVTLLDGATGSVLLANGMPRGICTELWVLDHKSVIQDLQKAYVDAGSQILYAPTFGANRVNLAKHGRAEDLYDINCRLIDYCREAVGPNVFIAGDLSPSGKFIDIDDDYSYDDAVEMYSEQIRAQLNAGIDLVVAETMLSIPETIAAVDAAKAVSDLPVMCSLTVDAVGSLYMGGNAFEGAAALEAAGADAVGINCSVGPDQLESVVRGIREAVSIPVLVKPNAGMPTIDSNGQAVYNMTPEEFARHIRVLKDAGATLIGGCCGTSPDFIRAIRQELSLG